MGTRLLLDTGSHTFPRMSVISRRDFPPSLMPLTLVVVERARWTRCGACGRAVGEQNYEQITDK